MAESTQLKTCAKCGEIKPVAKFGKQKGGAGGLRSCCKVCLSSEAKKRRENLTETQKEDRRQAERAYLQKPGVRAKKNESQRKHGLKHRLKYRFGITIEEYSAMLLEQQGGCKICGKIPKRKRLVVDHDHVSGIVRGLLCAQCNHMLGLAYDDSATLRSAALYLEENG